MDAINNYITFRYKNWLDYARHMARMHKCEGWENDLLNDVICDLLKKDENILLGLLSRKTKKIINGQPTTELDKFVLKMIQTNAFSPVAPFRKNTMGKKVIKRASKKVKTAQHVELNGTDRPDEVYNQEHNDRLDAMHSKNMGRLRKNGFTASAVELYNQHFIRGRKLTEFSTTQQESIALIRQFLVITKKTLLDD